MKKKKASPVTMRRFQISERLYKEGLNGTVVVARGGLARSVYLAMKEKFDAPKTT